MTGTTAARTIPGPSAETTGATPAPAGQAGPDDSAGSAGPGG
ncbi:hypothetical protein ACFYU9_24435 [Streptomyces sp. NPDC004327]